MDRAKAIEWVQKLLNKAMDPAATDGERDALQRKAEEFMARYKISEMEAVTPDEIKGHEMLREDVKFVVPGRTRWGYDLAWGLAPVFECQSVRWSGTKKLSFFGFPEDVKTCVYFYRTLQMQIVFAVDATGYTTVKEKNSYAFGMVARVVDRLRKTYAVVKEIVPPETKELMIVKDDAVNDFVEDSIGKVGQSNLKNDLDAGAFRKGINDGARLDIARHDRGKVDE